MVRLENKPDPNDCLPYEKSVFLKTPSVESSGVEPPSADKPDLNLSAVLPLDELPVCRSFPTVNFFHPSATRYQEAGTITPVC